MKINRKKLLIGIVIFFVLLLILMMLGSDDDDSSAGVGGINAATLSQRYDPNDTWAIYWYLCGTDLETEYGAASEDLEEMMRVSLPPNVKVVIETGGTEYWQNGIASNVNSRYLYDSSGFLLVETIRRSNMGSAGTLENFLRFCNDNYPADHKVVIFWNHGGGSVAGIAFDELYNEDALTLQELRQAFGAVHRPSKENPPYELIGFDACLMATIDVADTLNGFAKWMVASQELEPGCGWDYEGFLQALAKDPGMNGAMLGKHICDTFYRHCAEIDMAEDITLSVVDLSRVDDLMAAYYNVGAESLLAAIDDTRFFSEFGRIARRAENYGGNTRSTGYSNMVDLGDKVFLSGDRLLPEYGQAMLDALEEAVVYQVRGPLRQRAQGLSAYYNYDGDYNNFLGFASIRGDHPFRWFYDYALTGQLSREGIRFAENLAFMQTQQQPQPQQPQQKSIQPAVIKSLEDILEDYPLYFNDDADTVLELGPELADQLVAVYCILGFYDDDEDIYLLLGRDHDVYSDWEKGIFHDNFQGTWGGIDGEVVYMEAIDVTDDHIFYTVPILLNGREYSLRVSYSYETEDYTILGARRGIDDNGMGDRQLRRLRPGDVIEPLLYFIFGDDEDFTEMAVSSITVTRNTRFEDIDMGDGLFSYMYEMVDVQGNSYYSDVAFFLVEGDDIWAVEVD